MRVTIVVDDNVVLVDGLARMVDCSPLIADGLHAVQWYHSFGEEEFRTEVVNNALVRKPNNNINDFAPYEPYIEQWRIEDAKQIENEKQRVENQKNVDEEMRIEYEKMIEAGKHK